MPIKVKVKEKTNNNVENYLNEALHIIDEDKLKRIAEESLKEFVEASPDEGIAKGWSYEIVSNKRKVSLFFNNSKIENGENVAIIIDVGHGTRDGRWISGKNYLSKPTQEAYDNIINKTWEALKSV